VFYERYVIGRVRVTSTLHGPLIPRCDRTLIKKASYLTIEEGTCEENGMALGTPPEDEGFVRDLRKDVAVLVRDRTRSRSPVTLRSTLMPSCSSGMYRSLPRMRLPRISGGLLPLIGMRARFSRARGCGGVGVVDKGVPVKRTEWR
jgi:hypothetical protein